MTFLRIAAAPLLLLATGCPSLPCQRADLEQVATMCRVEPAFSPTFRVCREAGLVMPPAFDVIQSRVAVCDATGSGAFYACLARECAPDGGRVTFSEVETFSARCRAGPQSSPPSPAVASTCASGCGERAVICRNACPTSDWNSCADCDARCSEEEVRCDARCPS